MEKGELLKEVLKAIIYRAELFLIDEMHIEAKFDANYRFVDKIDLKKYTTMIGIGGAINLLFYVTYNDSLLDNLTRAFAYGDIPEAEFIELRDSAAGEIANTIIGHSLSDFPNRGKGVTITPPVTIEDAKSIVKTNGTGMITARLVTPYGNMEFNVIGLLKGEINA
ncbi:MAG: chemotaxis protein CheX [Sulfuricurvum sp.]|uniref:chemotaxis protein CheX n=1 Tax=Sulfuricurvum sp. TaxID=2025608 RepID=UPI0025DCF17E|nr:chemotaxis protein CheX [Sulfuricurvum sp.]MBV5320410.1 chemotaxis protein CheX [Sulfuricurvum sp.]